MTTNEAEYTPLADCSEEAGESKAPEGSTTIRLQSARLQVAADADYVVLALPGQSSIALVKSTATVCGLIKALQSRRLIVDCLVTGGTPFRLVTTDAQLSSLSPTFRFDLNCCVRVTVANELPATRRWISMVFPYPRVLSELPSYLEDRETIRTMLQRLAPPAGDAISQDRRPWILRALYSLRRELIKLCVHFVDRWPAPLVEYMRLLRVEMEALMIDSTAKRSNRNHWRECMDGGFEWLAFFERDAAAVQLGPVAMTAQKRLKPGGSDTGETSSSDHALVI